MFFFIAMLAYGLGVVLGLFTWVPWIFWVLFVCTLIEIVIEGS